ncbi:MAG: hypothetical protein ACK4GE_04320 [Caldimicrobium sp.]
MSLQKVLNDEELKSYYWFYRQRTKDLLVDTLEAFLEFKNCGEFLKDDNFFALFIYFPGLECIGAFYLLYLKEDLFCHSALRKRIELLKDFFMKVYRRHKLPIIGARRDENRIYVFNKEEADYVLTIFDFSENKLYYKYANKRKTESKG